MTYSQKYGRYGIYTDGLLHQWFKTLDNAKGVWNERFAPAACAQEWLEEYDDVELRDMATGKVIYSLV